MPNFDKYSNYNENAGVSGVVFGSGANVLEVEMNEMQEVQRTMLRRLVKNVVGDGVSDTSKIEYADGVFTVNEGCAFTVNGYVIECNGLSISDVTDGNIYLQVWEDVATSSDTLKEGGNQQKGKVTNYFKDSRTDSETSRRKVLKYTLATSEDSEKENLLLATVESSVMTLEVGSVNLSSLVEQVEEIAKNGGSGGGIAPSNMKAFSVKAGDGKLTVTFTDPDDTVLEDILLCSWGGTKVVIKEGSYPENEKDGTVVLDSKVRNQYAEDGFVIENLTNLTEYYIQFFPYSDQNTYNRNEVNRIVAIPKPYTLYQVRIKKSNSDPATRVEYIGDSVGLTPASMDFSTGKFDYGSFENAWFVKDNYPCMLKYDGTEDYRLDPNDYTKKESGGSSDVANTSYGGNAMSAMPLVYLYLYEDSDYQYINLCDIELDENYKAYAHTDQSGVVHDYMYMAMFRGSNISSKLRSLSGQTPLASATAETEISYAVANGSGWFTKTWAQRVLLQSLMTVMFKSTNSQAYLGQGNLQGSQKVMTTGTLNTSGQFWGANDTTHQVKAFHMESVWADQWDRIAGCINDNGKIKVKMTAPYPTSGLTTASTFANFIDTGVTAPSSGYLSATKMTEYGAIPSATGGSETTYESDYFYSNNTQVDYARVGGDSDNGALCGLFCLNLNAWASVTDWRIGASPSYLSGN